jgi:mono/diheme cytochrome c family protein
VLGRDRRGTFSLAALVLAALLALLSACSSSSARKNTSATAAAHLAKSRKLFVDACAACHTLTGHDTHADGGDLGLLRLTQAQMLSFERIMPTPPLSSAQLIKIARYVVHVEQDEAKSRMAVSPSKP